MSSTGTTPVQYEKTHSQKLKEKAKAAPFVPVGIAGMIGMVAWGAYRFRHRGGMSTSIFLMHLRVKAQGVVVGALALGVAYSMGKDYIWDKENHQKELAEMNRHH